MGAWAPFRLAFRLATPLALNHPWLHLDGLLAHCIYQRVLGRDYYNLPTKQVQHLARERMGPYWRTLARSGPLVHASVSFYTPEAPWQSLRYFKRFEAQGYPRRHKVPLGRGHYRVWMLRTTYLPVEWVTFYGCGDLALVEDLVQDLTHLGNDHRVGWGEVAAIELEPLATDRSLVWEGRAQRPLPVALLAAYDDVVPLAWRPPYWAADSVAPCAPPGARVELRPDVVGRAHAAGAS